MKRIMLSVALMMGVFMFANAQTAQEGTTTSPATATVAQSEDDGFKDIKLEALNEKVQAAIKNFSETHTVKALAFNEEKKITKVTLASKADSSKKIVLLNEEGKEVKENK